VYYSILESYIFQQEAPTRRLPHPLARKAFALPLFATFQLPRLTLRQSMGTSVAVGSAGDGNDITVTTEPIEWVPVAGVGTIPTLEEQQDSD
jgi:hypothetical protein